MQKGAAEVKRAPLKSGIKSGIAGVAIAEACISIYCGYNCGPKKRPPKKRPRPQPQQPLTEAQKRGGAYRTWGGGIKYLNCFAEGTAVLTACGSRTIESVRTGDLVYGIDLQKGVIIPTLVLSNDVHENTSQVFRVTGSSLIATDTILMTENHPLYDGTQWRTLQEFAARGKTHRLRTPEPVALALAIGPVQTVRVVYNLRTACGNYLVGACGLVVSGRTFEDDLRWPVM